MSEVRIYQPAKNVMQSGRANSGKWVLEYAPATPKRADRLMGWIGSHDTLSQVRLTFDIRDEAVDFAKKHSLAYAVSEPKARRVKPKNYADNFAYDRVR